MSAPAAAPALSPPAPAPAPPPPRRVGVLGCGALGKFLIRAIAREPSLELAFAWNRSDGRLDALVAAGLVPAAARCGAGELLAGGGAGAGGSACPAVARFRADVVIEVCHPDVTAAAAAAVLRAGADFVCGSPTALADDALRAALAQAAAAGAGGGSACGVYVPAGALWGAGDIARMSARGALRGLEVTMRKHPASLKLGGALGEALAAWVARGPPAAGEEELVLYEGPVRALCPLAPNNVNTMAAAALAAHETLGFDGVRARLVADTRLDAHVITVDVRGDAPPGGGAPFRVLTERYNPAPPGAVTGAATFAAVFSSLLAAHGLGAGLHMC